MPCTRSGRSFIISLIPDRLNGMNTRHRDIGEVILSAVFRLLSLVWLIIRPFYNLAKDILIHARSLVVQYFGRIIFILMTGALLAYMAK